MPGGASNLLSRALADAAPLHFNGQRVTVMTRQGGAGAAGMQYMQGRTGEPLTCSACPPLAGR